MAFPAVYLLAFTFALVVADESCPPANEISPCTCDGEGFNCMDVQNIGEIRKAFRAKFKYGGVRAIWIQNNPITEIPANLFGNVRSKEFYIEINNVSKVDVNAFYASNKTMITLSLFGNKLSNIDYSGLRQYERLSALNLGRNKITTISDGEFNVIPSLTSIILAQNQISHVGKNAFSNLPRLEKIDLSFNQLQTLGPMSLASNGHSFSLVINLWANQISSISSSAFQGTSPSELHLTQNKLTSLPYDSFGPLITRIGQKKGLIEITQNPLTCQGCDYSWIVDNKDILNTTIQGFTCQDGRSMRNLTKSNIQCDN